MFILLIKHAWCYSVYCLTHAFRVQARFVRAHFALGSFLRVSEVGKDCVVIGEFESERMMQINPVPLMAN